jgi:hypothetical protein
VAEFPPELNQPLPRAVRWGRLMKLGIFISPIVLITAIFDFCLVIQDIYIRVLLSHALNFHDQLAQIGTDLMVRLAGSLLFIFIIFWFYKELYKERVLIKRGAVASATILSEKEYSGGKGSRYMKATYQFTDADNKTFQGVSRNLPRRSSKLEAARMLLAKILDNPIVLYDPQNPERSMLYPGGYTVCYLPQGQEKR